MRVSVGVLGALVGLLLAFAGAPPATAAEPDVTITLAPGGEPDVDANLVTVTKTGEREAEWVAFNLTTPKMRVIVRVVSEGYFAVDRARQVVPEVDDHFLFESKFEDVRDPASGGRLVNMTKSGATVTLDIAFDVEGGKAALRLSRDVRKPTFQVEDPTDVQPHSFLVKTVTNEYALGAVWYWPRGTLEEPIPLDTTIYAYEQTFPVQGLDENTSYTYRFEFHDWAKNRATSGTFNVTTSAVERGPEPFVLDRSPEGDYPEGTVLRAVEANYTTPVGVIDPALHVRMFVDLTEVTGESAITATRIRWTPEEPFAPGFHRVGLELLNSENGESVTQWTFTIAGPVSGGTDTPFLGLPVLLGALVGAGLLARRRR